MPGNMAHAIMNIDENLALTENYFLADSLDDWVHGMMTMESFIHDEATGLEEDIFWKAMYFKYLEREDREEVRAMRDQVEYMVKHFGGTCDDVEEEDDEVTFLRI